MFHNLIKFHFNQEILIIKDGNLNGRVPTILIQEKDTSIHKLKDQRILKILFHFTGPGLWMLSIDGFQVCKPGGKEDIEIMILSKSMFYLECLYFSTNLHILTLVLMYWLLYH